MKRENKKAIIKFKLAIYSWLLFITLFWITISLDVINLVFGAIIVVLFFVAISLSSGFINQYDLKDLAKVRNYTVFLISLIIVAVFIGLCYVKPTSLLYLLTTVSIILFLEQFVYLLLSLKKEDEKIQQSYQAPTSYSVQQPSQAQYTNDQNQMAFAPRFGETVKPKSTVFKDVVNHNTQIPLSDKKIALETQKKTGMEQTYIKRSIDEDGD